MAESEKAEVAKWIEGLRITFELALSDKRKYPLNEFQAFVHSVRRYIELTADDPIIHKSVATAVNGLREFLQAQRKRVPGGVLFEADRLECQLFGGCDPAFDGDEPSGF